MAIRVQVDRMADADKIQLDSHLGAYLGAYQEFLTNQVEMRVALRDGHLQLAHARRELSRTRNTGTSQVSSMQYPSEFEALLMVHSDDTDPDMSTPTLTAVAKPSDAPPTNEPMSSAGAKADTAAQKASKEAQMRSALEQLGVADDIKGEIADAVADDEGLAMAYGDRLVVEVCRSSLGTPSARSAGCCRRASHHHARSFVPPAGSGLPAARRPPPATRRPPPADCRPFLAAGGEKPRDRARTREEPQAQGTRCNGCNGLTAVTAVTRRASSSRYAV